MPVKVIDASALAAMLFAKPSAEIVADQMLDCSLAAPALFAFRSCQRVSEKAASASYSTCSPYERL